jgi:RNA polymerase sigma factor (sigma-70 family)
MTVLEFNYNVDQSRDGLKPFAYKLTRDTEDANDLLQETMLKALTNRDKFLEGTNLKAWLYTIMRNTFISNYQKTVRRNTFTDNTENQHHLNSSANSIENLAYTHLGMGDIKKALKRVEPECRQPFLLYFRGYKYHEIAEKLEVPLGTVKNRIHLARKLLKNLLICSY